MSLVVDVTRGTFRLAGATTRFGFNRVVRAASVVVTILRVYQALEDAVEAASAVQWFLCWRH